MALTFFEYLKIREHFHIHESAVVVVETGRQVQRHFQGNQPQFNQIYKNSLVKLGRLGSFVGALNKS